MPIGLRASLLAPALLAALALIAAPARAQPAPPPPAPPPVTLPAPGAPAATGLAAAVTTEPIAPATTEERRQRLRWRYAKFRTWEWVASATVSVASLVVQFGTTEIPDRDWRRGLFFDDNVRNKLVATSADGRRRAAKISDISWPIVQYFPVVDAIVTPLATDHGNWETTFQMTLLNWEAQSLAFLITRATHRSIGRSRPLVSQCDETNSYDVLCNPRASGRAASFLSGHTSMAFAGAGLTCAHHLAFPMYGARWADVGVCALGLAGATATGVLRIVADRHWTSDVLTGAAVGLGTGWLMPWALHYASWNVRAGGEAQIRGTVLPSAVGDAGGVGVSTMGLF